jgi:septum formation protein
MEQNRKIVLASASPRRKELLEKIGLKITVDPGDFQENMRSDLKPDSLAKFISLGKASLAAQKHPDAIIIAADTFGVLRGKIIGKPASVDEARSILISLSGKSHRVITGFTILDPANHKSVTRIVETRVYIKQLSLLEIENYVKTGEPMDKAGAYAIQGLGALLVDKIVGDYYNVMGLPLKALAESLKEFGIDLLKS